ncbi:MAG: signal peptidase I [Oscillospiraceae bacterium]|nr:signal peptidase I [Oscillospiraceae bacterium]
MERNDNTNNLSDLSNLSKEELLDKLLFKEAEIKALEHNVKYEMDRENKLKNKLNKEHELVGILKDRLAEERENELHLVGTIETELGDKYIKEHELVGVLKGRLEEEQESGLKLVEAIEDKMEVEIGELEQVIVEGGLEDTPSHKIRKRTFRAIGVIIVFMTTVMLLANILLPTFQIERNSMVPTLNEGETIVFVTLSKIIHRDIIAFHHGNDILVKRVIAVAGDWVDIAEDGSLLLNGELFQEPYIKEHGGEYDMKFPVQVPDKHFFVVGDNRLVSIDSRHKEIGFVNVEDVIGGALLRVWPFKSIGFIS